MLHAPVARTLLMHETTHMPAAGFSVARFVQSAARYVFATTAGAALVMGCTVQLARVEGHSMAPTLVNQDRLVVDRLTYRIGKPTPGDIVMFHVPVDPGRLFVKRIIAEAGDEVRIQHGDVFVNGHKVDDRFIPDDFRSQEDWGPYRVPHRLLPRAGRPPEPELGQPALGPCPPGRDHRAGPRQMVAPQHGGDVLVGLRSSVLGLQSSVFSLRSSVFVLRSSVRFPRG